MRYHGLALATCLLAAAPALAQTLQPPQAPPAADPRLDQSLQRWESAVKGLKSFEADVTRYEIQLGAKAGSVDVYVGKAKYLGPDRVSLRMDLQGRPGVYEHYICTGTFVYSVMSSMKTVHVYELPKTKQGAVADDTVLSMLFTIKANDVKKRYGLSLQKEDQLYYYIGITPQTPEDKIDFTSARLVLRKDTFLPREIWMKSPAGSETKWDISRINFAARVAPNEFAPPAVPPGWTINRNPQPRVIREKQP